MPDRETMGALEHEMGVLVRRLRRRTAMRARAVHPNLSPVAYSILVALHDSGPRRASEMAEIFSIDKGAVSRQVQALVELGLVERIPDPGDRRAATLAVTDQGRRSLEQIAVHRRAELTGRLADWSPEELSGFVRALTRYNRALEPD